MQHKTFNTFEESCNYYNIIDIIDSQIFNEAITHSSFNKVHYYERLEFLGDTILNFCISRMIFENFPQANEGEMSKKKSFLISRQVAKNVVRNIKLDTKIKVAKNINFNKDFIIADILESFLCVVYYEYGIDKTYNIVEALYNYYLYECDNLQADPKTKLQEYSQQTFKALPIYKIISKTGTEHEPYFIMSVECGKNIEFGEGRSKKIAEKQCAEKMLKKFKLL